MAAQLIFLQIISFVCVCGTRSTYRKSLWDKERMKKLQLVIGRRL
ncbi:unnamed protein product [Musa acuminata subsp. malaccensis]|uniref:(wild Malaysian banana) hypothetical protein n=1 Tax=Musa acuminata subsp. malaccensis TaxID=214687 RepID=A0A804L914_MUSAM|nr:unnamed protein product [Musa acuminata subsp. malaccensis]